MAKLFAALLCVLALSGAALARDLTADEQASLDAALARFETASRANDRGVQLDLAPKGLWDYYATVFPGLDQAAIKTKILETPPADPTANPDYTQNDIHEDKAQPPGELSDGTLYVVMPMSTVVYQLDSQGGGQYEVRIQALTAIREGEDWKFIVMTAPRESGLHAEIIPAVDGDDAYFAAIAEAEKQ